MIEASGSGLFGHGFTYSGHPVSAAVALRALEIYEERKLYEHVRNVLRSFSNAAGAGYACARGDARGIGLLGAVELVRNKETKWPSTRGTRSREVHGALPGARLDRARDRRRGRALSAVHREAEDVDDIFDRLGDGSTTRSRGRKRKGSL